MIAHYSNVCIAVLFAMLIASGLMRFSSLPVTVQTLLPFYHLFPASKSQPGIYNLKLELFIHKYIWAALKAF